ncbi:hypothetical protein M231_07001 [Tremella mesenterica]|uniref:NAD(P)-binding domain-containing protein n=1 Tax=Tremella mesenterica TaxID=5217 RepID=A0A4V1M362_TREME|nr:hypothetical protein M231_07001 [Tremella mesenterica]
MHAAFIGASRGCGLLILERYLKQNDAHTAILLVRDPDTISDGRIGGFVNEGRVKFVKGDATKVEDVRKIFEKKVDVVITSIGGASTMTITGAVLDQPLINTDATVALLIVLGALDYTPRVIAVSSMGAGKNHSVMPLFMRFTSKRQVLTEIHDLLFTPLVHP